MTRKKIAGDIETEAIGGAANKRSFLFPVKIGMTFVSAATRAITRAPDLRAAMPSTVGRAMIDMHFWRDPYSNSIDDAGGWDTLLFEASRWKG